MTFALRGPAGTDGSNGTNGTNGSGYGGASSTSLAIGTGSKAFTTSAGMAYVVGSRVRAVSSANTANFMEGVVTAYSGTTLTVSVDYTGGSGTHTDWNLSLAGVVGAQGSTGLGFDMTVSESLEIGKGDQSITVSKAAGASAYVVGMYVLLVNSDGWMYGTITSYSGTAMTVTVTATKGTSGEPSAVIIQPASAPGSQWLTGSGVPDSSLGNDGDLYIDTASTNFTTYAKAAGSWS